MMELVLAVNPAGIEEQYLDGLNRCFGGWGDRTSYAWDFERRVGAGAADLMVLRDGGEIIAGSAVSYRRVRHEDEQLLVGIMTGSWTLPEARGRGAFSRMIVESGRLVAARSGTVLTAFVTSDNASRRRLVSAGSLEVATSYVVSVPGTPAPAAPPAIEPCRLGIAELVEAHWNWVEGGRGAHIVYPTAEIWASQFVDRPLPVERLTVAGCHCLVERSASSDRLIWIVGPNPIAALAALLARAIAMGRQLFLFTVDPGLADAGARLGMVVRPGSITVLPAVAATGTGAAASALPVEWRLQGGDRA